MIMLWTCGSLAVLGLALCGLQILSVRTALRQPPQNGREKPVFLPPVSILKPLRGLDDNLFDNLSSFCTQDYPEYELIFSLQSANDPAYKVARKVMELFPSTNVTLLVEPHAGGLNPKVNNLIPAYRISRYDTILISDSNVLADRTYLRRIVAPLLDPEVGLVTSLIRGVGSRSFGSLLENLHLNSFIVGSVCFLDRVLGMPCVIGKSMLMRKRDLEAIGGLHSVRNILAEDFIIGREMHRSGKRVVLSDHFISNVNQHWNLRRFLNRHTRWGRLRWKIGGVRYFSEILANPVFIAALPILVLGATPATVALAGIVAMLKTGGDRLLGRFVGSDLTTLDYLLVPVKDLLIGAVWFVPLLSNTVVWRGNRYVIRKNSRLTPCPESGLLSLPHRMTDAIRARVA